MKHTILFLVAVMFSLTVMAQTDGKTARERRREKAKELARKVETAIDSISVRGVDKAYICAPEKPWQIIAQGNVNQSDLKMKSVINGNEVLNDGYGEVITRPHIKTTPSTYVGLWAGYRGYGIGFSKNVGGDKGTLLKAGVTGGAYGVNFRLHNFKDDNPSVGISGMVRDEWNNIRIRYSLPKPIETRTIIFDAYYMFNKKRFSYAAAYDMSVIQKRSAGSPMAAVMYYNSRIEYAHDQNANVILFMNDVAKMRQSQFSAGAGYAYNWVPVKGLLVSAMAVPMLTFYNRFSMRFYNSNLKEAYKAQREHPEEDVLLPQPDEYKIWQTGKIIQRGKPSFNLDSRLSVTYNARQWFFNTYGQLNSFYDKRKKNNGQLTDWFVCASIGIRL